MNGHTNGTLEGQREETCSTTVFKYRGRICETETPANVRDAASLAQDHFRIGGTVKLYADVESGLLVKVAEHVYKAVAQGPLIVRCQGDVASADRISFVVYPPAHGAAFELEGDPAHTLAEVKAGLECIQAIPVAQQALLLHGEQLEDDNKSLAECGLRNGDPLELFATALSRKPVIYLFTPDVIPAAKVTLTLVPAWSFTSVYPVVTPTHAPNGSSSVTWSVSASPSGALVDLSSGEELAYLFWEAQTNFRASPKRPPRPGGSPGVKAKAPTTTTFDPSHPSLTPANAVLLPLASLLPYLSNTLKNLTMHAGARNDFITYWLPSLVRLNSLGQNIAMRFVKQSEYATAARLEVEPTPDVVTRVFMLFGGVAYTEEWADSAARVATVDWGAVIGLSPRAGDFEAFCVLEWGGMEVMGL